MKKSRWNDLIIGYYRPTQLRQGTMRRLPPYLAYKLQQLTILCVTFLVIIGALKLASFFRLDPKISLGIPPVMFFTCPLFGCLIIDSRDWWKGGSFWTFTAIMAITHLLAFLNLTSHTNFHVGRWVFITVFFLELGLLIVLRNWLLPKTGIARRELP